MKRFPFHSIGLILIFLAFLACNREQIREDQAFRLFHPVLLNFDESLIKVSDFVPDSIVDSVTIQGQLMSWAPGDSGFVFKTPQDAPAIMTMKIWTRTGPLTVLLKKSTKQYVRFEFDPKGTTYKKVQLKGEFNNWTPENTSLLLKDGKWQTLLLLNKGKYQYQLVLDGKSRLDPANPDSISNNMGGYNSLMVVGSNSREKEPVLITDRYTKKEITITTQNEPKVFIILWNNVQFDTSAYRLNGSDLVLNIPEDAKDHYRSTIRVYSYNKAGCSNDVMIPLHWGKVLNDPSKLTRHDRQGNIMYNVFVDRFVDGDTTNTRRLPDTIVLPPANYHGGDIAGIQKMLKDGYFSGLEVNTLWISPVVKNPDEAYGNWPDPKTKFSGYHGYWPLSFTQIDDRMGTPEVFKNFVEEAHSQDVNVLLDFVAHHVHENHPFFKANPTRCTPLRLPDGSLNLERWDDQRLTTWFDVFLPTLNLGNDTTAQVVSDSAVWWLTQYQIDGFRHDAAKHVPLSFWRMLTSKINQTVVSGEKRPVFQMGETYGSVELISSYVQSGLLDAQFDFNLYDAAVGVFAGDASFRQLADRIQESLDYYGSHNTMGYITGNQDRARFISYAGGDLKFSENAKMAGWKRNIGVGDTIGYRKLSMLMALNMTIPGIPVIYYGDEFGMPGGNDPDSRRMMRFGEQLNAQEKRTLETTRQLVRLRKENMALLYGDFCLFEAKANTLTYARKYFDNVVIVLFNNSKEEKSIALNSSTFAPGAVFTARFGSVVDTTNQVLTVKLPGTSFEILTSEPKK